MPAQPRIVSPIDRAEDVLAIKPTRAVCLDDNAPPVVDTRVQPATGHNTPLIHDRTYFVAGHEARIEFADPTGLPQASLAPLE